jgi:uncharacterized protein (UPF0332 family)
MAAFEDCLAKGRIKKIEPDVNLVARELATAKDELDRARTSCASGNWNDTAMQSYFVLTRCARAAINARGFKDTNLYGLQVAIEHLFIEPGDLDKQITKDVRDAKDVKDAVYNGRRATPFEAKKMLVSAQKFARFVFERLALPGFDAEQVQLNIPEPVSAQQETTPLGPDSPGNGGPDRPRSPEWQPRSPDRYRSSDPGRRYSRPAAASRPSGQPRPPESDGQPDWRRTRDWVRQGEWDRLNDRGRWTPPPDEDTKDEQSGSV